MPRPSRLSRAAKHGSMHSLKRVKGNNRFGSKGCMKCDECRRRKTKCEFDYKHPDEPCRDCKRRGAECGKTLPMQTSGGAARRSGSSSQSLSPSPSGMSSPEPDARWKSDSSDSEYHDDDDLVNDIPPPPPSTQSLPQNPHPISTTLEVFTNYARELESVYPPNSTPQVIENLRSHVAQGNFVELHELLFPPAPAPSPAPPAKSAPVVTRRKRQEDRKNVLPEIKVEQNLPVYQQGPYRPVAPTFTYSAGTVNPATLNADMIDPGAYLPFVIDTMAMDNISRASFESGSTLPSDDFQSGTVYDPMQEAYYAPPVRYAEQGRDFHYPMQYQGMPVHLEYV